MKKDEQLLIEINKTKNIADRYSLIKQDETIWDLFSRKEEYDPILLDRYKRFPHYISNSRNILEPIVSKFLINNGLEVVYPENKKFAVCLTHDIDVVQSPNISIITDIAKSLCHLRVGDALKRPFYNINKKWNPLWNFKEIIALEDIYGAKSSFFFMGLEEEDQDFNYKSEDLKHEMGYIIDQGCEVGLHGGHEAFNNPDVLKKEKCRLENALGRKVIGYRNHFLRFRVPDTWELLKKAGFKYDATFGYPDCVGFRNGMCHPFKPFNLSTKAEIDILEIPLAIMDMTFDNTYMRLDVQTTWRLVKHLIDTTEIYNGVLTILWHNTYMKGDKLKLYIKILDYCNMKKAWITSGKCIEMWWNKKQW